MRRDGVDQIYIYIEREGECGGDSAREIVLGRERERVCIAMRMTLGECLRQYV